MEGDILYTNSGAPILQVINDSRWDQADFINRQYSTRGYYESEAEEVHRNLCEDLHEQLMAYGLSPPEIPLPWPLWSRVSCEQISFSNQPSECAVGDQLVLQALRDTVVVVASCDYMTEEEQHQDNIDIASRLKFWDKTGLENLSFQKRNSKLVAVEDEMSEFLLPVGPI